MSGGIFNYHQHSIRDIYEEIEHNLDRQGKPLAGDDLYEWNKNSCYDTYPPEVAEQLKEGVRLLKLAYIYAHRIDWFFAGDDDNESFLERLETELNKLHNETQGT